MFFYKIITIPWGTTMKKHNRVAIKKLSIINSSATS